MGLIQQVFNIGNFTAPVLLGGISTLTGRRNSTCWITFGFPLIGLILVIDQLKRNPPFAGMYPR